MNYNFLLVLNLVLLDKPYKLKFNEPEQRDLILHFVVSSGIDPTIWVLVRHRSYIHAQLKKNCLNFLKILYIWLKDIISILFLDGNKHSAYMKKVACASTLCRGRTSNKMSHKTRLIVQMGVQHYVARTNRWVFFTDCADMVLQLILQTKLVQHDRMAFTRSYLTQVLLLHTLYT